MKLPSRSLRIGSAVGAAALALALCTTASAAPAPSHHQHSAAGAHSLQPRFGALPAPARPRVHYGTMTFGQITGTTPDYIFPVTPAADLSVYTADFENMMWRPLFWVPNGDAVPTTDWNLSVGEPPKFTDHNKIVTIHMKHIRWSNGQPVTATDVIFDFWMFEGAIKTSAANEGNYTPGLYPDNVASIRALNPTTVRIVFKKTYNQDFLFYTQLGLVEPLPWRAWSQGYQPNHGAHGFENVANAKKIYAVLSKAATSESTYATNRLWKTVDGPWRLSSFTPATGSFSMVPNRRATQHQPYVNKVVFKTFTSLTSEFNALLTNSIDVGPVDFSDLAKVPAIKPHYNVWGYPDFGWQYVPYNFKDHTGHFNAIINQLYIRQALAHLQNEKAVIQSRGIYDGAAYPAYGPVPSIPASPLAPSNATHNPYPFSIKKAGQILRAHGWSVKPGGSTTCVRPGSGKGDCGAGIPAGTPLSWNLVYNPSPASIGLSDEAWASNAKQVGIEMSLSAKPFNFMISNYNDVASPTNDNKWAMEDFGGFTGITYPTTNEVFNTKGSFDLGGFSSKRVDQAIHNSIFSLGNSAVKKEASFIGLVMPGLFQPNPDEIYAFSHKMSGPPQYLDNLSQFIETPSYWYFKKR